MYLQLGMRRVKRRLERRKVHTSFCKEALQFFQTHTAHGLALTALELQIVVDDCLPEYRLAALLVGREMFGQTSVVRSQNRQQRASLVALRYLEGFRISLQPDQQFDNAVHLVAFASK